MTAPNIILSYSDEEVYIRKCMQVKLLTIDNIFDLRDLVLFHKIINGYIPIYLPSYVARFNGSSRLRDNHLDSECFVCNIDNDIATSSRSPLFKNYFYRIVSLWNKLPHSIRSNSSTCNFKQDTINYFLDELLGQDLDHA